jgi:chemotaxis protein MotB
MRKALAFTVLLSGCVTQGTYDALKADDDAAHATLDQREKELAETKASLAGKSSDLDKLKADLAAVSKEKSKLEADLSAASSSQAELKGNVEAMKKTLADLAKRKEEAEARVAEFKGLLDRFKGLIDAGKLKVKMVEGKMVLSLASDILFASGSSNLSKDGKAAVAEVSQLLASIPDRKFQVEGHTDNVPSAGRSNWDLGSARALNVLKTMVEAGMPPNRISAATYGDSQPAKPNDTPEGKAANRRIEIVVVPDLTNLPGFEELNKVQANDTAPAQSPAPTPAPSGTN